MAKQTTVTVVDDMDGSPGASTVTFGIDGKSYVIDLSEANATKLREAFAPFVAAGRKVGSAGSAPRRRLSVVPSGAPRRDTREIRAWLVEHGYPIKEKGRIPAEWEEDFRNGQPNPPVAEAAPVSGHRTRVAKLSGAQVRGLVNNELAVESGTDWAVLEGNVQAATVRVSDVLSGMNANSPKGKALAAVLRRLQEGDESVVTVAEVPVAQSA